MSQFCLDRPSAIPKEFDHFVRITSGKCHFLVQNLFGWTTGPLTYIRGSFCPYVRRRSRKNNPHLPRHAANGITCCRHHNVLISKFARPPSSALAFIHSSAQSPPSCHLSPTSYYYLPFTKSLSTQLSTSRLSPNMKAKLKVLKDKFTPGRNDPVRPSSHIRCSFTISFSFDI